MQSISLSIEMIESDVRLVTRCFSFTSGDIRAMQGIGVKVMQMKASPAQRIPG